MRRLLLKLPFPARRVLGYVNYHIAKIWVYAEWRLLGWYYQHLLVQAGYIYRSSERYKLRWEIMGQKWADDQFADEVHYYFKLAKRQPIHIRWQLFKDALAGREPVPYALSD